jgi:Uma2 family endonuclease
VADIVSPSSKLKDTITKYSLYETFGISYYVIINPEDLSVNAFSLENDHYTIMEKPYIFHLDSSCSISPDFDNVFS